MLPAGAPGRRCSAAGASSGNNGGATGGAAVLEAWFTAGGVAAGQRLGQGQGQGQGHQGAQGEAAGDEGATAAAAAAGAAAASAALLELEHAELLAAEGDPGSELEGEDEGEEGEEARAAAAEPALSPEMAALCDTMVATYLRDYCGEGGAPLLFEQAGSWAGLGSIQRATSPALPLCFRSHQTAPSTAAACFTFLTDGEQRKAWDEQCHTLRTLQRMDRYTSIVYYRSAGQWPTSPRDMVLISHKRELADAAGGRLECEMTTVTNLDPRGDIPQWLVKVSTTKKTPEAMRKLQALCGALEPIEASGILKAGFAGGEQPRVVFPSHVGRTKHRRVMPGGELEGADVVVGEGAAKHRGILKISFPIEHGVVSDWADMERIWKHVYSRQHLSGQSEEPPVLLTEPALNPTPNRERAAQVFFEQFNVPTLFVATQAILSLYASGRTTGVVLDCGDRVTHAVP
eukprot:g5905.t1